VTKKAGLRSPARLKVKNLQRGTRQAKWEESPTQGIM